MSTIGATPYVYPMPTISSLSPSQAVNGTTNLPCTAMGTGFGVASVVKLNGTAVATTFSGGNLSFVIPTSYMVSNGTINVTVTNPHPGGGTSSPATFTVGNPVPVLTSISPNTDPVNSPDQACTATGSSFLNTPNASVVNLNGSPVATTFNSSTSLGFTIPASMMTLAGTINVTVTNPTPLGGTSSAVGFTVTANSTSPITPPHVSAINYPADNPAALSWFNTFTPTMSGTIQNNTPQIWVSTTAADPGRDIVCTGNFPSPSGTVFQVYGQTSATDAVTDTCTVQEPASLANLTGNVAHLTLPTTLPTHCGIMLWTFNATGYGQTVLINKAAAWRIQCGTTGNNVACSDVTREIVEVFGENLSNGNELNGGPGLCGVYITPTGTTGGAWVDTTGLNISVSSGRVRFTLPTLSAGTYDVFVNNGLFGSLYGYSICEQKLVVSTTQAQSLNYSATSVNLSSYNVGGDGNPNNNIDSIACFGRAKSGLAALITGLNHAGQINLVAGTYQLASVLDVSMPAGSNLCIKGSGPGQTFLKPFGNLAFANSFADSHSQLAQFQDLTIDMTGSTFGSVNAALKVGRFLRCQIILPDHTTTQATIDFTNPGLFYFQDSLLTGHGSFGNSPASLWVDNSIFNMTDGDQYTLGAPLVSWGGSNIRIGNSSFQDLNYLGTVAQRGNGRAFVYANNAVDGVWFGNNQINNLSPPGVGQNAGEIVVGDGPKGWISALVTSTATVGGVTTVNITGASTNHIGQFATVTSGTNLGNAALITNVVGNTLTFDRLWTYPPDTSTRINVCSTVRRFVMENNVCKTLSNPTSSSTMMSTFMGSLFGIFERNKGYGGFNSAWAEWGQNAANSVAGSTCSTPFFFNRYRFNDMQGVKAKYGIRSNDAGATGGIETYTFLGTTRSDNNLVGCDAADWVLTAGTGTTMSAGSCDNSSFRGGFNGILTSSSTPGTIQVIPQNSVFQRGGALRTGSAGKSVASGWNVADVGCTFFGFSDSTIPEFIPAIPPPYAYVVPGNTINDLYWHSSPQANSYNIKWNTTNVYSGATLLANVSTPQAPYSHTGLTNGSTYYYWITALDGSGVESAPTQCALWPLSTGVFTDLVIDANNTNYVSSATFGDMFAFWGDVLNITANPAGGWTGGNYRFLTQGFTGTSNTPVTTGTGSKTWTTSTLTGLSAAVVPVGTRFLAQTTAKSNWFMTGTTTSYNTSTGAITANITFSTPGANSSSSWNLALQPTGAILDRSAGIGGSTNGSFSIQNKTAGAIGAAVPGASMSGPAIPNCNMWMQFAEATTLDRYCSRYGKQYLNTSGNVTQYTSGDGKIGAQFVPGTTGRLTSSESNGTAASNNSYTICGLTEFGGFASTNQYLFAIALTSAVVFETMQFYWDHTANRLTSLIVDTQLVQHNLKCDIPFGPAPPTLATGPSNRIFWSFGYDATQKKMFVDLQGVAYTTAVSGAVNNGSGLIRLTVGSTSFMTTGNLCSVSNVAGTTEANGLWTVTVIDTTHIDLVGSTFTNAYSSGGSASKVFHYELQNVVNPLWNPGKLKSSIGDIGNGFNTLNGIMYQLVMCRTVMTTYQNWDKLAWLCNGCLLQSYSSSRHVPPINPGTPPVVGFKTLSTLQDSFDASVPNKGAGLAWLRPVSIQGTAEQTAQGHKFVWVFSGDHMGGFIPTLATIYTGYSDDIGIVPASYTATIPDPTGDTAPGGGGATDPEHPFTFLNPDDSKRYICFEAAGAGTSPQPPTGVQPLFEWRTSDGTSYTKLGGIIYTNDANANLTAYAGISRLALNSWISYHLYCDGQTSLGPYAHQGYSVNSAPGTVWEVIHNNPTIASNNIPNYIGIINSESPETENPGWKMNCTGIVPFYVGRSRFFIDKQQSNTSYEHGGASWLAVSGIGVDAAGYESIIPGNPWRINGYLGPYPGTSIVQYFLNYQDDGTIYIYADRGFPLINAGFSSLVPIGGHQAVDLAVVYKNDPINLIKANIAKPIGVSGSATGGVVTLNWLDALPHQNYSVYRDGSWLQDVAGLTTTDSPSAGAHTYKLTARATNAGHGSTTEGAFSNQISVTV